jgi:hypothetical protein
MAADEIQRRTTAFALGVICLAATLFSQGKR